MNLELEELRLQSIGVALWEDEPGTGCGCHGGMGTNQKVVVVASKRHNSLNQSSGLTMERDKRWSFAKVELRGLSVQCVGEVKVNIKKADGVNSSFGTENVKNAWIW